MVIGSLLLPQFLEPLRSLKFFPVVLLDDVPTKARVLARFAHFRCEVRAETTHAIRSDASMVETLHNDLVSSSRFSSVQEMPFMHMATKTRPAIDRCRGDSNRS